MMRRRRPVLIGNDVNDPFVGDSQLLFGGSCQTMMIVAFIVCVVSTIVVVLIIVPPYSGSTTLGPTTPYPTRLTTSPTTLPTTKATTSSPFTTAPPPPLVLTCVQGSVNVPLGFPVATETFNTTLTGGCPPLVLSFTDAVVGTIAKRRQRRAFETLESTQSGLRGTSGDTLTVLKHVKGIRLGAFQVQDNDADRPVQRSSSRLFPNGILTSTASAVIPNNGASAPNFSMDVNANYVVTAVSKPGSGASAFIHVFTKALLELGGSPFTLSSLAGGSTAPCNSGQGQARVLWDAFAGLWLLSEISSDGSTYCLYVSYTQNPILTLWTLYQFPVSGGNASYPQFASFGTSWYIATVQIGSNTNTELLFFNRTQLVAHSLTTSYYGVTSPIGPVVGLNVTTGWTPVGNRGLVQTPGDSVIPGQFFIRQRDSSFNPVANTPYFNLDVMQYFLAPNGNLSYTAYSIPINTINMGGVEKCIPVPNSGSTLLYSGLQWMGSAAFNTINALANPDDDPPYRLYGTFVTNACGGNGGNIFWFELYWNNATSQFAVRQQGVTPQYPGAYFFLPSIAQDLYGNMVMVFSNSSATTLGYFPSMSSFSRAADDPLGTMRYALGQLVWAQGSAPGPSPISSDGWGWSQVVVADPTSTTGRQFYAVGSYAPPTANTWEGMVGGIRMTGEIVQRVYEGLDVCGQVKTCTFFINVGTV
jgi:hypothetical protein